MTSNDAMSVKVMLHTLFSSLNTRHNLSFFFFLMIRHPPISTLFPSTTLSRSVRLSLRNAPPGGRHVSTAPCRRRSRQLTGTTKKIGLCEPPHNGGCRRYASAINDVTRRRRSEEHTSELQSPCNLVCRLLLEKK